MDGGGLVTVPTNGSKTTPTGLYLVKASSGRIVRILVQGTEFAQCVFADNRLFAANNNGVFAWRLK
jgi:hypothetical protein